MENTQTITETTQGVESVFHNVRMEVIDSYPSIFSKDDVILLIDRLQRDVNLIPQSQQNINVENLKEEIYQSVRNTIEGFDYDDLVELELGYNRTIDVSFETDGLVREVKDVIFETIDNIFE